MKVYITKYALTAGIEHLEVDPCDGFPDMVKFKLQYFHGEGRDWHRNLESATARAEKMRAKRISSLKKQIAQLEKLSFSRS